MLAAAGAAGLAEAWRLSRIPSSLQQTLAPGYYIAILGGLLFLIGLAQIAAGTRAAVAQAVAPSAGVRAGRMLAVTAVLAAYIAAMPLVGYAAASLGFFIATFRLFGVQTWLRSVLLGLAYAAAFHVVFVVYCEVIFPRPMLALF